jgi:hypothetical protein
MIIYNCLLTRGRNYYVEHFFIIIIYIDLHSSANKTLLKLKMSFLPKTNGMLNTMLHSSL